MNDALRRTGALGSAATLAGGATGALLLALAAPAGATATYTVDTLADGVADPTHCTDGTPGNCTLRDAIDGGLDGDTIVFAAGLTGTITLNQGELNVGDDLNIVGPGADLLTVSGNNASTVFYFCANNGAQLSGVTITGGSAPQGAALYEESCSPVTLDSVVITGNTSTGIGGAIYTQDNLTIRNSVVTNNIGGGNGAGMYVDGTLTMEGTVVTGNASSGEGGGVYVTGSATITGSTISNNTATLGGGGVRGKSDAVITNSTIDGNTAGGTGGGVNADGSVTITGSTISGNIASGAGAGGVFGYGDLTVATSTIENNMATAGNGGGLYVETSGGTISITSSTLSGNSAGYNGGAMHLGGSNGTVLIANSTITGNSGSVGGGLDFAASNTVTLAQDTIVGNSASSTIPLYSGGGIHFGDPLGTISLSGTIVSGNTAAAGPADIGFGSPASTSGSITATNSLLGTIDSRLTVGGSANVMSTDPGVSALADNGGPTRTMLLLATSAALDAGPVPVATFPGNEFDQRGAGFPRVLGTKADIGAVEGTGTPVPPAPPEPVAPAFTG